VEECLLCKCEALRKREREGRKEGIEEGRKISD
jgi:hypothetical protein